MNYSQAKRAILEQAIYIRRLFPHSAHYCLIENAGYGVELILELKRELTGVQKITRGGDGDKDAASGVRRRRPRVRQLLPARFPDGAGRVLDARRGTLSCGRS